MYVTQKGHDLVIPLENIKDVNLASLEGVYRVDLYAKELFGDKFYFKPSLLYPFNHKKKEAVVNILWANIEKAKSLLNNLADKDVIIDKIDHASLLLHVSQEKIPVINKLFCDHGINVFSIEAKRKLEDYFLKLINA